MYELVAPLRKLENHELFEILFRILIMFTPLLSAPSRSTYVSAHQTLCALSF